MKICCQLPVNLPREDPQTQSYYDQLQKHFARVKRPDTEVIIKEVGGPRWESAWQHYAGLRIFNHVEILKSILQAEKDGCDGVSISCFFDPVLSEARQLLKIPVVSLSEASLHLAYLMGSRFAVITKEEDYAPVMEDQIQRYGLAAKAISHRPVRFLTLPLATVKRMEQGIFTGASQDLSPVVNNFQEVARGCIADGAEVLIMGCGLFSIVLTQAGLTTVDGAAVVEPMIASLKMTEMLVDLHQAGLPFVSRRSIYAEVPPQYITDVLASRHKKS
jgi:allantoin racemase